MNTRQNDILDLLAAQGEMTIKALAERLGVTEMTIHRDSTLSGRTATSTKSAGRRSSSRSPTEAAVCTKTRSARSADSPRST